MSTFGSRRDPYNNLSRDTPKSSFLDFILKSSFYLSATAFIIFIILIVLHFFGVPIFKFGADSGGIIPIPAPTNRQTLFNKQIMAVSDAGSFNNLVGMKYTVSIDVYVQSDFVSQSVPRVFLYRSSSPITLNSSQTNIDQVSAQMLSSNFIMYLDPDNNDLNVRIFTVGVSSDRKYVDMPPIENVPLRKGFKVTMMLSDVLLELYINGELQRSVPLPNPPADLESTSYFYGPPIISRRSIFTSNLSYWNTMLSASSIRVYGKEPVDNTLWLMN